MVDIAPFRGLLFNQRKVGPTNQVAAPPYDVISPEQQEALYKKNPYNVVRLILEKQYPEDGQKNNRYTRSSVTFNKWIEDEVLVQDKTTGFMSTVRNTLLKVNQFVGLVFLLESVRKTSIQEISVLTSLPLQKRKRIA